jgi:hypothetical protein
VPAISDILGVRSTTANDYLIACGLLMLHPTHGTVGPHRKSWESLKAMYQLEIESFPWTEEAVFPQDWSTWPTQQQCNI